MMKRAVLLSSLLLVWTLLAACAPSQPAAPATGSEVPAPAASEATAEPAEEVA